VEVNAEIADRFGMAVLFYSSVFNDEVRFLAEHLADDATFVCMDDKGSIGQGLSEFCSKGGEPCVTGPETADELAALFPTGGTTGKSKAVLMNHAAIETFFANSHAHLTYREGSVHLVVAPMTHSAGLLGCLHFPRGGCNVVVDGVDPLAIMQDIEKHGVTHVFVPPTVLYMMLAHPDVGKFDFSSLQHFMVGAAPTSLEKLKEALDVFGPCMTEVYGQAEAPAAITFKAPWDYRNADGTIDQARLASIGRPGIFNLLKIVDKNGNEVSRGEPGEICVRGRLVTLGYLDNPSATAEVHRDGWLWTGDVGVMAEDGYIRIVDRSKDMIITGGFNVYPNEIEQVIAELDAVQESAVIGVPDEKWGEAVKGIVQLKPGKSISEEDLLDHVKARLGSVKTPKSLEFVDDLPRSPVGKVLKTELRKPYWDGKTRSVN
jgi:acyl-CoA synthetase (AMP-forming)/AMP-acid ligase II